MSCAAGAATVRAAGATARMLSAATTAYRIVLVFCRSPESTSSGNQRKALSEQVIDERQEPWVLEIVEFPDRGVRVTARPPRSPDHVNVDFVLILPLDDLVLHDSRVQALVDYRRRLAVSQANPPPGESRDARNDDRTLRRHHDIAARGLIAKSRERIGRHTAVQAVDLTRQDHLWYAFQLCLLEQPACAHQRSGPPLLARTRRHGLQQHSLKRPVPHTSADSRCDDVFETRPNRDGPRMIPPQIEGDSQRRICRR